MYICICIVIAEILHPANLMNLHYQENGNQEIPYYSRKDGVMMGIFPQINEK